MPATLRSRLGRALLVALSPVLGLGALHSVLSYRDEVADRRAVLSATALRSAAEVRVRIESGAVVLNAIAPDTAGADCAERLRAVVARLNGYDNLVRIGPSGEIVCAARPLPSPSAAVGASWLQRLRDGERFVVAPSAVGFGEDGPALIAATRLGPARGRFGGALVAVIPLATVEAEIDPGALPGGTAVAVTDEQGRLFGGADPAAFGQPGQVREERIGRNPVRTYRAPDSKGVWRDHVAAPLIGRDVFVLLSAPAPGLFSWAWLNLLFSLVLPLLAFAAAFGAVWLTTDRLVIRWLHYLQRIAAVYGKGRLTVRPQVADDAPEEVQALARTLDEMAEEIARRDQMLRDNLAQKDALMREIHHRVKNNLQVITSLLNLQQRALADPAGRAVLADTRQRISALALIYRALYQSEDLRRVDVRSFLEELVGQLVNGEGPRDPPIRSEVQADELMLDPDKLAPFALFAVEAVTNAQKHAFAERGGALNVRFTVRDGDAVLEVEDDGVGVDPESMGGGVGRTLMTAFARQLRGKMDVGPGSRGGVLARLAFPVPEPAPPSTH